MHNCGYWRHTVAARDQSQLRERSIRGEERRESTHKTYQQLQLTFAGEEQCNNCKSIALSRSLARCCCRGGEQKSYCFLRLCLLQICEIQFRADCRRRGLLWTTNCCCSGVTPLKLLAFKESDTARNNWITIRCVIARLNGNRPFERLNGGEKEWGCYDFISFKSSAVFSHSLPAWTISIVNRTSLIRQNSVSSNPDEQIQKIHEEQKSIPEGKVAQFIIRSLSVKRQHLLSLLNAAKCFSCILLLLSSIHNWTRQ
jgi:hypothetical protein